MLFKNLSFMGYPNYSVTNTGKIWSHNRKIFLSPGENKDGYLMVNLYIDSKHKNPFTVHKLVGLAFVPNPYNYKEINHLNGIKNDNVSTNLKWCTRSENVLHAFKVLNRKAPRQRKTKCITTQEIFDNVCIAARYYNIHQQSIHDCCNKNRKSAGKHPNTKQKMIWEFVD